VATITLEPRKAWEQINQVIAYMTTPGSPSWWQHRAKPTPTTLRHVDNNFLVQYADRDARKWYPNTLVPYDGPPQVSSMLVQEPVLPEPSVEEMPIVHISPPAAEQSNGTRNETNEIAIQIPPPATLAPATHTWHRRGMIEADADALVSCMQQTYPLLSLCIDEPSTGIFYVGVEYAAERWVKFGNFQEWYDQPMVVQRMMEKALVYGPSRIADMGMIATPGAQEAMRVVY